MNLDATPEINETNELNDSTKINIDQSTSQTATTTIRPKLPIITHTCPTPNHTPSNSSRNLPFFSNYELEYDIVKVADRKSSSNETTKINAANSNASTRLLTETRTNNRGELQAKSTTTKTTLKRRHSLESGLKCNRFVSKASSSKIYDQNQRQGLKTKRVLFYSNNNLSSQRIAAKAAKSSATFDDESGDDDQCSSSSCS